MFGFSLAGETGGYFSGGTARYKDVPAGAVQVGLQVLEVPAGVVQVGLQEIWEDSGESLCPMGQRQRWTNGQK